jgi:hypothetical protein
MEMRGVLSLSFSFLLLGIFAAGSSQSDSEPDYGVEAQAWAPPPPQYRAYEPEPEADYGDYEDESELELERPRPGVSGPLKIQTAKDIDSATEEGERELWTTQASPTTATLEETAVGPSPAGTEALVPTEATGPEAAEIPYGPSPSPNPTEAAHQYGNDTDTDTVTGATKATFPAPTTESTTAESYNGTVPIVEASSTRTGVGIGISPADLLMVAADFDRTPGNETLSKVATATSEFLKFAMMHEPENMTDDQMKLLEPLTKAIDEIIDNRLDNATLSASGTGNHHSYSYPYLPTPLGQGKHYLHILLLKR